MGSGAHQDLTALLQQWRQGDDDAASRLLGSVYGDLRRIARGYMREERAAHTLQATALVHEAWLRVSQMPNAPVNREQFFRSMAAHMRRQLVDHARRRRAAKRGGGAHPVELDDAIEMRAAAPAADGRVEDEYQRLDTALEELALAHPRASEVLELRFFANKSIEETAAALSVATGTVKRDFAFARSFVLSRLTPEAAPPV